MTTGFIQVTTTVDSQETAHLLQELILTQRLAACVQVMGPIESRYWWEAGLETTVEWLLVIKTKGVLYDPLEAFLLQHHPYQTPEILATPIEKGYARYLNWLNLELQGL